MTTDPIDALIDTLLAGGTLWEDDLDFEFLEESLREEYIDVVRSLKEARETLEHLAAYTTVLRNRLVAQALEKQRNPLFGGRADLAERLDTSAQQISEWGLAPKRLAEDADHPAHQGKFAAIRRLADLRRDPRFPEVDAFLGGPFKSSEHLLGEDDYWFDLEYNEHLNELAASDPDDLEAPAPGTAAGPSGS